MQKTYEVVVLAASSLLLALVASNTDGNVNGVAVNADRNASALDVSREGLD